MNREDIIRMITEACKTTGTQLPDGDRVEFNVPLLQAFASLVTAAEREACAKVCLEGTDMPVQKDALKIIKAERKRIAKAIQARSEK